MDPAYRSEVNRDVAPARPGEFGPLRLGPLEVWPPVVLAPMAGVTNAPFRRLCRRYGAGLYVSEMITARPLVESRTKTLRLAGFAEDESPRSLQLYGIEPFFVGEAVARLVGEGRVDHLDLNFGCPVPKVTRRGGGAALPLRPRLLAAIVRAAVGRAGRVPVTMKFRLGIDDERLTFLETGRIGREEGATALGLHARTAAQLYDGAARWDAIGELRARVTGIPVLGNGDIWEAEDALRMMRATGCDGVIVGRGCLGKPWLFRELASVFTGREAPNPPTLGEVLDVMLDHAGALAAWTGEREAMRAFRRQVGWYTKGFRGSAALRAKLRELHTVADLERVTAALDRGEPFPVASMRVPRGKGAGVQRVALPASYGDLDDAEGAAGTGAGSGEALALAMGGG